MRVMPSTEREYIFSFEEREFPVYGPGKNRIGNCKKIYLCDVEKQEIHAHKTPSGRRERIREFLKDRLPNGLFLQLSPSEECIALRPTKIITGSISKGSKYYIIPKKEYSSVKEMPFLGIGSSISNEAIVLKFDVGSEEDLSEYKSFFMKGDKNKLLW